MKAPSNPSNSKNTRIRFIVAFAAIAIAAGLLTVTAYMKNRARPKPVTGSAASERINTPTNKGTVSPSDSILASREAQDRPQPDVVQMIGPVSQDQNLNDLPYIPPRPQAEEEQRLLRHPLQPGLTPGVSDPLLPVREFSKSPNMPSPSLSFGGMTQNLACGTCLPPDTDGDVGPNHYIQSVNSSIRVHDKSGNVLAGPITYNSFFSALGASTPCGNAQNDGDGIVFYDHIADRWVVSDFAFPAFPGTSFYQCIGVSKASDPVAGGWFLYAVQTDPANTNFLGDYPKFGLWPDAYYLSVNLFSNGTTFNGVRVFALNRNAMISGGAASTIAFTILPADLGDQYSLLPATFRTGSSPPVGQPEWFMDINSSTTAGTVETQVFVRRFHVDFVTPANSTFGVGATHTPDGTITVTGFVDAFTSTGTQIVPQTGTTALLDTLGDKLMYPLVYQNLSGTESIYSAHSVNNNQGGTGPTAVRWYQFNMTGNTIPATPVQQQTFNNGADGFWRFMPSLNVDSQGNLSIGYSKSSAATNPAINYAGRLASDSLNNLAQGEALLIQGNGSETNANARWGDYSATFVDPSDTCTFWHTNEYFTVTSAAAWSTRVGTFKFAGCTGTPLPSPTPTATPTPTPSPTPPVSAGPVTVTATAGTLGPTDYATVKAAFDAINAGTHQATIRIFILADTTEAAAAVLNASGSGSASYTSIRMQPSGARTVTGALATPLIDFNGADFVTIDGMNSGGNSLTISNSNSGAVATTSTIRFINGATNNVITNATILGSFSGTIATNGGTIYFATDASTTNGNDNNTISFCNIGPVGANLPSKAIFSSGSTTTQAIRNSGNVIDSNNIFDFFRDVNASGIHIIGGSDLWTISNNRLYQTAPRVFTTAASRYAAITLNPGATGSFTVTGNTIGFGAANGTGTTTLSGSSNEFRGIDAQSVSTSTATSIQGNTISGINQTTSRQTTGAVTTNCFVGIMMGSTGGTFNVGTVTGNTIGSLDGSSTIVINETSTTASTVPAIGIYDFSLSSNNISNNKMGSITINSGGTGTTVGFRGILINTATTLFETVNNNIIGGTTAGSITDNIVGSYAMYGIQVASANLSATGNTVRNMVGNSNGAALIISSGLLTSGSTGVNTISQNTIHSLSNNSGAASNSIYALYCSFATVAGNLVQRNLVHSLSMTSSVATGQLVGILPVAGSGTYQNNMVRLGIDAAGGSITTGFAVYGMFEVAGTNNLYFNSVYVGGSGVASSSNTFGFVSNVTSGTRNYVDNIFWNARSNASGAGKNYAIAVGGTVPNPPGLTSNYNDLYATGTGGFVGIFNAVDRTTLANWQTATGQDANSISADPQFINPNGTAATVDLHILGTSPCVNTGLTIAGITIDYDGQVRDAPPDIGADEIFSPTAAPATISGRITAPDGSPVGGAVMHLSGAASRTTISDSAGNYRFDDLETESFYTVTPSLANYQFAPASRSISLIGNITDAGFTANADAPQSSNAIDTTEYFVRQQYLDFLGREPDQGGFEYWSYQINQCGGDAACIRQRRIDVSAAFFASAEFQQTGSYIYGVYAGTLGRTLNYDEFNADRSQVLGGSGLDPAKTAFAQAFVQRPEFINRYPQGMTREQFVDAVIQTMTQRSGVGQSSLRNGFLNDYDSGGRALVVRHAAEASSFVAAEYNKAFVLMEYFGYLRREIDQGGYDYWLDVLNNGAAGNYRGMVCAFVTSTEYQLRFSTAVTRSNAECGP
jgi:hypothetical protein